MVWQALIDLKRTSNTMTITISFLRKRILRSCVLCAIALAALAVSQTSLSQNPLPSQQTSQAFPQQPTVPPVTNAVELPAGWRGEYVREPVLGSSLYVVTIGEKHRPTLVLLHGLGQNGLMDWQPVIDQLKQRYYIVAFDLPGFGRSSMPAGRLSPENYAYILHWLVKSRELQNIHLAGHSLGGAVALYYAATYPETLSRLTLVDVAGILHRAAFVKSLVDLDQYDYGYLPNPLERAAATLLNFGDRVVEKINVLPDVTEPLQKSDLIWNQLMSDRPNTNAALSLIHTDYSYILDAITTPTMIIWGSVDPVAPVRTGYLLQGKIADSELHIIPGAQHVPLTTHTTKIVGLMSQALSHNTAAALPGMSESKGDLICRDQTGARYSGRYDRIRLHNCLNAELFDVQAESIELHDSTVQMTRVSLQSSTLQSRTPQSSALPANQVALRMDNSSARITDAHFSAPVAIALNASRVDLAGVHLSATKAAIRIEIESTVVISVSESDSPWYQGKLHGIARAENSLGENLRELRSDAVMHAVTEGNH